MTCEQPVVNTASLFTNRVTVILSPFQEDATSPHGRKARIVSTIAMLDTGATESNFISRTLADELISLGGRIRVDSDRVVCSAFSSRCVNTNETIMFTLTLYNTITKEYEDIVITARVIDGLRLDLIVGCETLGEFSLLPKLLPQLCANRNRKGGQIGATDKGRQSKDEPISRPPKALPTSARNDRVEKAQEQQSSCGRYNCGKSSKSGRGEHPRDCELCALLTSSMSFFGDPEGDD